MLVEHARNVLGNSAATHAEYGRSGDAVIVPLSCSLQGRQIEVWTSSGTRLSAVYGGSPAIEHTTCDYGLRADLSEMADRGGMTVAAVDGSGEVRAIERSDHPFFVGTLYQPQLSSRPGAPHPLITAFLRAL